MTNRRTLFALCFILVLVVTGTWIDRRRAATETEADMHLVRLGDVSKLDLLFRQTHAVVVKDVNRSKTTTHWALENFQGKPVKDWRVNDDMINHLVDLIKALGNTQKNEKLDPTTAREYGADNAEFAVTLEWDTPRKGQEQVIFGHRDLTQKKIFAFFPKRPLLVEVEANTMDLLASHDPLDVRDRRITTFDADDVEDLVTTGRCGSFKLSRDGDRWLKSGTVIDAIVAETWLSDLLGSHYDLVEEEFNTQPPADTNPICEIKLAGRKNRTETIQVFKSRGTLWARNSKLPSQYRLPQGIMKSLIPPTNNALKPSPGEQFSRRNRI